MDRASQSTTGIRVDAGTDSEQGKPELYVGRFQVIPNFADSRGDSAKPLGFAGVGTFLFLGATVTGLAATTVLWLGTSSSDGAGTLIWKVTRERSQAPRGYKEFSAGSVPARPMSNAAVGPRRAASARVAGGQPRSLPISVKVNPYPG